VLRRNVNQLVYMKSISLPILLFIFINNSCWGQNLINNSNFDDYFTYIDSNNNLVYHPESWHYSSKSSYHPIYFSSDRYLNRSLTWNPHPDSALIKKGFKINYISIVILPYPQKTYTVFKQGLQKNKKYHLSIDIKAFELSSCLSDLLIGFKDCLDCNIDSTLYNLKLVLPDSICNDALLHNWHTVTADFIASGEEKVLVVSAGSADDYLKIVYSNQGKYIIKDYSGTPNLKYYIDNVSLNEAETKNDNSYKNIIDSLKIGESIILQNIYFEFDKYVLLKESFALLDKVVDYLNRKRDVKIQVSGHTDNIGSDPYNDDLSSKRANSVIEYLITKGIAGERLQVVGYGSRMPIDSNNTEDGRQRNRRIEMKIIGN
jgi:outer membrane protein OmpA-like peptidoglycan-associated protein